DVLELTALAEFDAHRAIARQVASAGQYQVAHSTQPAHGHGMGAAAQGEARDLGQAAGDERSPRIVSVAEPIRDACGDGDYVLERASQLHTDHVIGPVDSEAIGVESVLGLLAHVARRTRDGNGGWNLRCHLPREARTSQVHELSVTLG